MIFGAKKYDTDKVRELTITPEGAQIRVTSRTLQTPDSFDFKYGYDYIWANGVYVIRGATYLHSYDYDTFKII